MRFFIISSIFFICLVFPVFGQNTTDKINNCTDETAEKISSRGIKIGSKLDDIVNLFKSTEEEKQNFRNEISEGQKKRFGYAFFGVSPQQNPQSAKTFEGISDYIFNFINNDLLGFSVNYTKPKWESNTQFAEKMAEIFDLPNVKDYWKNEGGDQISIQCGNYKISTIFTPNSERSTFSVQDSRLGQIIEQRRLKAEEKKREEDLKTFKP